MTKSPKFKRVLTDYEEKRLAELYVLYRKLTGKPYNWTEVETWWTLNDIACSAGRYKKYQAWYQKAYEEKRMKIQKEENKILQKDEKTLSQLHYEISHKACHLMMSRNEKYWDSWKVLTIQSLANLCEMKLNRIARLGEVDAKTEDELIDVLNYCVFWLIKLKEINGSKK